MKFGIGTAQFSKNYGFLKKKLHKKSLKIIFSSLNKQINLIDTAPSYGKCEEFIGKYANKKYKIITKIDKIKKESKADIIKEINLKIKNSLNKLNRKSIYSIMFHNEDDIKVIKENKLHFFLNSLKKKRIIKKIGISIYSLNDLPRFLKVYKFDIIQVPLNLFTINKDIIKKVILLKKKHKFELHVRSVFYQGIIFKNNLSSSKLKIVKNKLAHAKKISKSLKITLYDLALSAVNINKLTDYVIIGINELGEYNRLKKFKKTYFNLNKIKDLYISSKKIDLRKLTN